MSVSPSKEADDELLEEFFAANFHQDWHLDFDSETALIANYRSAVGVKDALGLAEAIVRLARRGLSEKELSSMLSAYGLESYPIGSDGTATTWLLEIAQELGDGPVAANNVSD